MVARERIRRFAKDDNVLFLRECDENFKPLEDPWGKLGTMKGTRLEQSVDTFKDKSGPTVVIEETTEAFVITTTVMRRDTKEVGLPVNIKDRFFLFAVVGQQLGVGVEVHVLVGRVLQAFQYELGGEAMLTGLKIVTTNNPAPVDVELPEEITNQSVRIPAGMMWAMEDINTKDGV